MIDRLTLGTANFGMEYGVTNKAGALSFGSMAQIVKFARNNNIFNIDTAQTYRNAEKNLGILGIEDFKVTTKITGLGSDTPDSLARSVQSSLEKTTVDNKCFEAILAHDPFELTGYAHDRVASNLALLKDRGYTKKIGFSVYSDAQLNLVLKQVQPDVVQIPFNLLDQRAANSNVLYKLKSSGCEIHVRSIFLQGLLAQKDLMLPKKLEHHAKDFNQIFNFCRHENISVRRLALLFVMKQNWVDKVIIGVDSVAQFSEVIKDLKDDIDLDLDFLRSFGSTNLSLIEPYRW